MQCLGFKGGLAFSTASTGTPDSVGVSSVMLEDDRIDLGYEVTVLCRTTGSGRCFRRAAELPRGGETFSRYRCKEGS